MTRFHNVYHSFSDFYDSFFRGNEIEFRYNKKQYYIVPHFKNKQILGVCIGESYSNNETVCLSESELFNACIENTILGKIVSQIDIVWKNL